MAGDPPKSSKRAAETPSEDQADRAPSQETYWLGRYRVVDEIGVGGMASVHLALMDGPGEFQKWVAIKRIHPHLVEDDNFIAMFLDEARIAARISHPNVATVFELGKHEDIYWIAMEYLHGEPLREVMRRTEELGGPMPSEIACRVIADAAEGLHAAHELLGKDGECLELVHRDVSPHNLFVTYDGTTKVVDFGIAKFSSRMTRTRVGIVKGKLAYMSPEQVRAETVDRRTDIFALGVVLWELTTGQRLFRMDSDIETLTKVRNCVVPPPSTLVAGYPPELEAIVMRALERRRVDRFATARELSRALQGMLVRQGLFVAGDEVAAYLARIFRDRIEKRDAHLRRAAKVGVGDAPRSSSSSSAVGASPAPAAPTPLPIVHRPSSGAETVRPPRPFATPPVLTDSPALKEPIEEFDDADDTLIVSNSPAAALLEALRTRAVAAAPSVARPVAPSAPEDPRLATTSQAAAHRRAPLWLLPVGLLVLSVLLLLGIFAALRCSPDPVVAIEGRGPFAAARSAFSAALAVSSMPPSTNPSDAPQPPPTSRASPVLPDAAASAPRRDRHP